MYKEPESPPVSTSVLLLDLLRHARQHGWESLLVLYSLAPPRTLLLHPEEITPEEATWARHLLAELPRVV